MNSELNRLNQEIEELRSEHTHYSSFVIQNENLKWKCVKCNGNSYSICFIESLCYSIIWALFLKKGMPFSIFKCFRKSIISLGNLCMKNSHSVHTRI